MCVYVYIQCMCVIKMLGENIGNGGSLRAAMLRKAGSLMCVCMYACMCVNVCVYVYIYIYIYVYIYICACVCDQNVSENR